MATTAEYDQVLHTVARWPAEQRAALAHALVDGLREANGARPTLDQLVGIARGPAGAPTDEQVGQWIDEHRTRKYGS